MNKIELGGKGRAPPISATGVNGTKCTNLFHAKTDSLTEHTVLWFTRIPDLGLNTLTVSGLLDFRHDN